MKRLTIIGALTWILLLLLPMNLSAVNHRQSSVDFKRAISAVTDDYGDHTAPMANQADTASGPRAETDVVNQNAKPTMENDTQKAKLPEGGVVKSVPKPVAETADSNEPVKEISENAQTSVEKSNPATSPKQVSGKSDLKLENILLYISSWWLGNPLNLQIWYLFCLAGLVLIILRLREFRRPLLFLSIIILGFYLGSSLDPIAAVFNLVPKTGFTFEIAFFILGIAVFLSLFLGRFYCGWLCPLGAVQELIHPETKIRIPAAPDAVLKYLKYIILLSFLYLSWRTGENLWSRYEPLGVLVHFNGSAFAVFILIVTLSVSVLIERPFCRYICPLGAILALTSRLAIFRMRADAGVCMVCGKCSGGDCAMNAIEADNAITDLPKINSTECIYCLRCQKLCQRSALHVSIRRIDNTKLHSKI
jgi:ferredoxin-type protein NapH